MGSVHSVVSSQVRLLLTAHKLLRPELPGYPPIPYTRDALQLSLLRQAPALSTYPMLQVAP
jgi:hypothetical protein